MRKLPQSGFTLIELLIVIAIIMVLSAVGAVGYMMAVRVTRDAKRQADLKIISSALEQYQNDAHNYPPNQITFTIGMNLTDPTGTKVYLNDVPTDPSPSSTYPLYLYTPLTRTGASCSGTPANCQCYCLYAVLEAGSSMAALCPDTGSYNLEVTPP